jgi:hypothetical protein
VAFGNPGLLHDVGIDPVLESLAERQYRNDEQIDDSLRSILVQIPGPGARDPSSCGAPAVDPSCFSGVQDLGAIDIQRGRDHGVPSYNQLRAAYGLPLKRSYAALTGESPKRVSSDLRLDLDDPRIIAFTRLLDGDGKVVRAGSDAAEEDVVSATRRTTLAARLKAIYGPRNVNRVDAFVGMLSEPHVPGTEFGPLQLAIWRRHFQALRDGDRFYLNDPLLATITHRYGIDYRQTLASIINMNTGEAVHKNVFEAPENS